MKKFSFFLNCAATALFAIALTACQDVKDNPSGNDNPAKQTIEIKNGDELATIINQLAATAGDEIIVELPAGIEVLSGTIDTPAGKKVTIVSDAKNPATIVMTNTVYCANAINVKNVYIDAKNLTSNVFAFTKKNADETLKNETGQYQVPGDAFVLDNVIIDNIPSGLLYDGGASYVLEKAVINNCILHFVPAKSGVGAIYLNSSCSGVADFNVTNTTAYSTGNYQLQYFIKFNNSFRADRIGYDKESASCKYNILNNTFYNLVSGNFANHTGLQRYVAFTVKNNIFSFSANLNQVIRNICGNSTNLNAKYFASVEADSNCYVWNGEFKTQNYNASNVNNVEIDPGFSMPGRGLFHPTNKSFPTTVGDLRWFEDAAKWQ